MKPNSSWDGSHPAPTGDVTTSAGLADPESPFPPHGNRSSWSLDPQTHLHVQESAEAVPGLREQGRMNSLKQASVELAQPVVFQKDYNYLLLTDEYSPLWVCAGTCCTGGRKDSRHWFKWAQTRMTLFRCILPRSKALQVTLGSEATAATSAASDGPESPFVCLGISVGKI